MKRNSLTFAFLIAASLLTCGCANEPARQSGASGERIGHIYLFRGIIDFITFGIDEFMTELNAEGFRAATFSNVQGGIVGRRIEQQYARETTHEPVVLIGYSTGVGSAAGIARRLYTKSVPVDLVITIDPSAPVTIPRNVHACVNYYEQTIPGVALFPLLSGFTVRGAPGVQVENIKLTHSAHLTIDQNRIMHADVIARLKRLCPVRQ